MLGSNVLEIAIGMLLIYTILSLICSAITELIAEQLMSLRSKKLDEWIRNALESDDIVKLIYDHPLISTLRGKGNISFPNRLLRKTNDDNKPIDLPAYIPAKTFALVLFDVATGQRSLNANNPGALNDFKNAIQNIDEKNYPNVRKLLTSLILNIDSASDKAEDKLRAGWTNIETWFDDVMEQATAEYKRNLRWITLVIALVFSFLINADTLLLVSALANDPAVRSIVVAQAEKFVENPPAQLQPTLSATALPETTVTPVAGENAVATATPTPEATATPTPDTITVVQGLQKDLETIGLFGWSDRADDRRAWPNNFNGWLYKILGILITTFAISMGAPFWFDLLNKLVNLRTAGAKPAKAAAQEDKTPAPADDK